MNIRVIKKLSFDLPPKPYYVIRETVTNEGHTIDWVGSYSTETTALEEIARVERKRKG